MAKETLVSSQVAGAQDVVRRLDSRGEMPSAALWQYFPDASTWKFVLAVPGFDELLPKKETVVYQKIAEVLAENPPISSPSIADIKLLKTDNPLVAVVAMIIRTKHSDARIEKMNVNGVFIDEMIVIRSISPAEARDTSKAMKEAAKKRQKP